MMNTVTILLVRFLTVIGILCCVIVLHLTKKKDSVFHKIVCTGSSCEKVLNSRHYRLFGIPNPVVGIFYYVLLFLLFFSTLNYIVFLAKILSLFAAIVSMYLTGVHLKLRLNCIPCWIANGCNVLIAILLF